MDKELNEMDYTELINNKSYSFLEKQWFDFSFKASKQYLKIGYAFLTYPFMQEKEYQLGLYFLNKAWELKELEAGRILLEEYRFGFPIDLRIDKNVYTNSNYEKASEIAKKMVLLYSHKLTKQDFISIVIALLNHQEFLLVMEVAPRLCKKNSRFLYCITNRIPYDKQEY